MARPQSFTRVEDGVEAVHGLFDALGGLGAEAEVAGGVCRGEGALNFGPLEPVGERGGVGVGEECITLGCGGGEGGDESPVGLW